MPHYFTPIQAGRCEEVGALIAERHLASYIGPVFEEVCRQWLVASTDAYSLSRGELPLILDIGRWWGNDPQRKEQAEIDIVAVCDNGDLICGECTWQEKLTDASVLATLQHRADLIRGDRTVKFILFSKSGFTEDCRAAAQDADCTLVTPADMGLGSV